MKKRIAAEWEPAIGVMVAWPASLPRALVRELASDTQLYLLCADDDVVVAEARETLERWGVDAEGVRYLRVPKGEDSTWPRDWGPQPLFDADGTFKLLGPRYVYSTPFCGPENDAPLTCAPWLDEPLSLDQYECDGCEDAAAGEIARQLGVEFVKLPFAFTGGNVLTDGIDSILSTEVLLLENKFDGLSVEEYFDAVAEVTGMANYSVFSDYEDYSLQHVDCFLKVLDDHRLLVQRPPADHPLFERYERIVQEEIACAVNSYGKPWEILRVDTGVLADGESMAAYVNSLILNTCVYVPQYGIPEDERALEQWPTTPTGCTRASAGTRATCCTAARAPCGTRACCTSTWTRSTRRCPRLTRMCCMQPSRRTAAKRCFPRVCRRSTACAAKRHGKACRLRPRRRGKCTAPSCPAARPAPPTSTTWRRPTRRDAARRCPAPPPPASTRSPSSNPAAQPSYEPIERNLPCALNLISSATTTCSTTPTSPARSTWP